MSDLSIVSSSFNRIPHCFGFDTHWRDEKCLQVLLILSNVSSFRLLFKPIPMLTYLSAQLATKALLFSARMKINIDESVELDHDQQEEFLSEWRFTIYTFLLIEFYDEVSFGLTSSSSKRFFLFFCQQNVSPNSLWINRIFVVPKTSNVRLIRFDVFCFSSFFIDQQQWEMKKKNFFTFRHFWQDNYDDQRTWTTFDNSCWKSRCRWIIR